MMVLFKVRATPLKTVLVVLPDAGTQQDTGAPPQALSADHSFIRTLGTPSPFKKIQQKKLTPHNVRLSPFNF